MGGSEPRGVLSWEPSRKDDDPTPRSNRPAYGRSIGWAIVGWLLTAAVVYLVSQVRPELGGWLGLAGVIVSGWFGGTRGGISGTRAWVLFAMLLLGMLILAVGIGGCAYALALYG